jgi:RHS repeat-associated protein
VTDQNGRVHEHVEYFPYGEVWRDARYDSDGAPDHRQQFLFSAKELDEETGLYYSGSRYLDPVRARFTSTDPALSRLMEHNEAALSAYTYGASNPLRFVDPDGLEPVALDPSGGHHFVPNELTDELVQTGKISGEAAEVFKSSTTGWGEGIEPHQYSAGHKEYTAAVRAEFEKFGKGKGTINAAGARAFVEQVKGSPVSAIKGFLEPHLKVVQLIREGATKEAINAFWQPIRTGFTRRGGFAGFARGLGGVVNKGVFLLNLLSIKEEIDHVRAGDIWVPIHPDVPTIGSWAPPDGPEARSYQELKARMEYDKWHL